MPIKNKHKKSIFSKLNTTIKMLLKVSGFESDCKKCEINSIEEAS